MAEKGKSKGLKGERAGDASEREEKERNRTTRREFVKGTAVGAAGVAAAGVLAGCAPAATPTPQVIKETVEVIKEVEVQPWLPEKWDREEDVVVVGAGAAGLLAAIEAAEAGAKTVILESEPQRDGSSPLSGGAFTFCETELEPGSRDELFADLMESHNGDCVPELSRAYVENASDTYKRMKECGVTFVGTVYFAHMSKPWAHSTTGAAETCAILEEAANDRGIEILLNTRGRRLISDPNKRVVGIEVESEGQKKYYKANRAVVLATGGFTRNPELSKNFGAPGSEKIFPLTGVASRGDGLIMGLDKGAHTSYICVGVAPSAPAEIETGKTALVCYSGAILVSLEGKRFHNESDVYVEFCKAALRLQDPQARFAQIYDSKIKEAFATDIVVGPLMTGAKEYQADTIEELGAILQEKYGLDADALVETVNTYNSYVEAGFDPDFGREHLVGISGDLVKIDTPPFYGVMCVPGTTHFNGGLKIDPNMHVIDVYGEVIPGLYAAGEVTGGFHGAGYMSGSAIGMAAIFGYIAGQNAAAETPWE